MLVLLHSMPPTLQQATTDPRLCWKLLDTHRQIWVSLLWGHCSFSWFSLCLPKIYFPVLCKFWRLSGGVNGDLLQEGLCHTQVSGNLPQRQGLWVQQTWVSHKSSWRRSPLTPRQSSQNLHRTGEVRLLEETNRTLCAPGPRRKKH